MKKTLMLLAMSVFLLPVVMLIFASLISPDAIVQILNRTDISDFEMSLIQYRRLLADSSVKEAFSNSVTIAVPSLIIHIPISFTLALLLAKARNHGVRILEGACVLALLLPFQIIMMPVYKLSVMSGVYDSFRAVIYFAAFAPSGALILTMLLRGINADQWEAASLETESAVRTLCHVIIPQIIPGIAVFLLVAFSEVWNMVEQPITLLSDPDKRPVALLLNDITNSKSDIMFAGAVMYASPVLILFLICALTKPDIAYRNKDKKQ